MKRRSFIGILGGAAAWPVAADAQQGERMPVIGLLYSALPDPIADRLRGFRQGLKESGYVEGDNVTIVYRFAESQYDRLPELAADLVRRQVAVIAAGNTVSGLAAKAATTTIPIVFSVNEDPVRLGMVVSLSRPGGNMTGINYLTAELVAKRLELLRELVPAATRVGLLVNPTNAVAADTALREVEPAARTLGLQIQVVRATTSREIDAAFATIARERLDALFVGSDAFFTSRRVQMAMLAVQRSIPAIFPSRETAEVGGLMSYGASIADAWRHIGTYAGRILKGAKPADLPVVQASKFELVINAQTARMLGLTVPPTLLARADEVIE